MILAPSLMDLKKKTPLEVTKVIAKFVSEKIAGIAILVQSEARG